jgi:soluble lytic murein transglycosylase-like protein
MLKERLNGYTVVEYKWVVFARLIFFCFFLIAGYVLTNTMLEWDKPAAASYALHSGRPENLENPDKSKPAVMKWMKQKSEMPEQVLSSIYDSALMHINTELILAVCMVESNFNPGVKSSKGAIGLMGIMPGVWLEELKGSGIVRERRDLFLIPNNIAAGVYVLKK